jgi:hypothetical protein
MNPSLHPMHPPDDTPIAALRNLGPASSRWLSDAGIHTVGDLRHLGVPLVMHILRQRGLQASMNLAYALEAALQDRHWLDLSEEERAAIRETCSAP